VGNAIIRAIANRGVTATVNIYHGFIFHRGIKKVAEQWAAQNDSRVYKTTIRECVQVQEAQGERQSLWEYAPRCTTARSYHTFMKEYLERNP
jgi:cellulose biosynthesis protein BcsQ